MYVYSLMYLIVDCAIPPCQQQPFQFLIQSVLCVKGR